MSTITSKIKNSVKKNIADTTEDLPNRQLEYLGLMIGLLALSITANSTCFLLITSNIMPSDTVDVLVKYKHKANIICTVYTLVISILGYLSINSSIFYKQKLGCWKTPVEILTFVFLCILFSGVYYGLGVAVFAGYTFANQFGLPPKGISCGFLLWMLLISYMWIALDMLKEKKSKLKSFFSSNYTYGELECMSVMIIIFILTGFINIVALLCVVGNCINLIMADPQSMEVFARSIIPS
ncbi:hypothetical protein NEFER03_1971 [Nematocida sp. LUAm3]|nr:hypothetical protein NEFER03_1971 [Nematocida sp. LUAm3]KAI5176055.1 hypothetical protein NEFER02_1889 [Nematocida sp. LUAm2]KAI5177099.1 hypothetical protein NEFER01_0374 [Nematocida sp. LUAm1]